MFRINRQDPWPPEIDLASIRSTLTKLERSLDRVPEFSEIAKSLDEAIAAIDKVEARHPKRLSESVLTTSRFMANSHES